MKQCEINEAINNVELNRIVVEKHAQSGQVIP